MNESRARIWFALFVLLVFCAGLGAGVVLDRTLGRPRPVAPRARVGPPDVPPRFAARLAVELRLTADQRQQLDRLLEERRRRLDRFHGEVQRRVAAEQQDLRDGIRALLTPEQQKRFDEWMRRAPPLLSPRPGGLGAPRPPR